MNTDNNAPPSSQPIEVNDFLIQEDQKDDEQIVDGSAALKVESEEQSNHQEKKDSRPATT